MHSLYPSMYAGCEAYGAGYEQYSSCTEICCILIDLVHKGVGKLWKCMYMIGIHMMMPCINFQIFLIYILGISIVFGL